MWVETHDTSWGFNPIPLAKASHMAKPNIKKIHHSQKTMTMGKRDIAISVKAVGIKKSANKFICTINVKWIKMQKFIIHCMHWLEQGINANMQQLEHSLKLCTLEDYKIPHNSTFNVYFSDSFVLKHFLLPTIHFLQHFSLIPSVTMDGFSSYHVFFFSFAESLSSNYAII